MEKSAFGESLKEILAERNIRPAGFAEEIGVSPATVYSWMSGATEPNLSALVRMADRLACSVDFLAGRSAENYPCASRAPLPPFAERVRAVMRECGISSYRLRRISKYDGAYFYNWEHGAEPRLSTLAELARLFDCSVDYLIGRG